jgi:hypothetical protein
MSSYPAITAAIADQHRNDLIAQADAYRLSREARQGGTARPSRPVLTARRLVAAAAAGCTAAAVFLLGPAAAAHAASGQLISPAAAHTSAHRFASPEVHFRPRHPEVHFRPRHSVSPAGHARSYRLVRWAAPAPAHHFAAQAGTVHFRGHVR